MSTSYHQRRAVSSERCSKIAAFRYGQKCIAGLPVVVPVCPSPSTEGLSDIGHLGSAVGSEADLPTRFEARQFTSGDCGSRKSLTSFASYVGLRDSSGVSATGSLTLGMR